MFKLSVLLLFVVIVGAFYLQEVEQSTTYHDKSDHEQFIKRLKEEGVPFRVDYSGQVFYPVSKYKVVEKIGIEITGPISELKTGATVANKDVEKISNQLKQAGIKFELSDIEGKPTTLFIWDTLVNENAMAIVYHLTKDSN